MVNCTVKHTVKQYVSKIENFMIFYYETIF